MRVRGEVIRAVRHRRGLTQQQIADAIGASRKQVTLWEGNRSSPSTAHLFAVAKRLDVDPRALVADD